MPEPCGVCDSLHARSGRQCGRCHRDRRGHQSRHRRDSRAARCGAVSSGARPLQDLHSRRSPPDHRCGLQRSAEDAGGAARAHHLHDGDHAAGRYSADHPLALPALQLSCGAVRRHCRSSCAIIAKAEGIDGRRQCAGACWRKLATDRCATRFQHHGPGDRLLRHYANGRCGAGAGRNGFVRGAGRLMGAVARNSSEDVLSWWIA